MSRSPENQESSLGSLSFMPRRDGAGAAGTTLALPAEAFAECPPKGYKEPGPLQRTPASVPSAVTGRTPALTLATVGRAGPTLSGNGRVGQLDGAAARPQRPVDEDTRSPRPPGPSTKPALIVVGIALLVTLVGTVGSYLVSNAGPPKARAQVGTAKGSPIPAVAAKGPLAPITSEGVPPQNVIASLTLPQGASTVAGSATNTGVGLYDRSLSFTISRSQEEVIQFFKVQLRAGLWHLLNQGSASSGGGFVVLAQHPGSDGYEWEAGVTVNPEKFATPPSKQGTTPFTLRLYQVSDTQ